ncbi:hypothetical protein JCM5350_003574 [Sporobolomyces pararoseus]
MMPPLSLDNVTSDFNQYSSPLPLTPSLPFPSSPTSDSLSSPPLARSRTSPTRSPRASQDSNYSSKRLSIASTSSATSASTSMVQKPHVLLRTRHTSLPASVVQSRHQSIVGTSTMNLQSNNGRMKAMNRISVASVSSFGSVEEEAEEGEEAKGGDKSQATSRSTSFSSDKGVRPKLRQRQQIGRNSLPPPGSLPSFTSVLKPMPRPGGPGAKERSSSPLRPKEGRVDSSEEERSKREERRLRIAEELRVTEKAYVQVLEEIDVNYYQPLLKALRPIDPFTRRASNRCSSAVTSPNSSPRSSSYESSPRSRTSTSDTNMSSPQTGASTAPSTPPTLSTSNHDAEPILSRREINEVFSNFTDVLNLSHVMLLTLNEAVPERPPESLAISTDHTVPLQEAAGSVESRLSSSGETVESSGPGTPHEDPSQRVAIVQRTNSRARRLTPAPPLRLGKALLPIVPFFKQYSLFVANFSGSLSRLSQLERRQDAAESSSWKEFVKSRKVSSQGGKIGLGGMLLNIVQRVPRYRLLLLELLEFTERDHPDLRDLETAFKLVDSVATHLDSQIESHTHDLAILDLQRCFSNLDFPLLSPGRRLLKRGILRKFNRAGKEQARAFLLFNDLLLHAVPTEQIVHWGLGISINEESLSGSSNNQEQFYKLIDKFELEDVTVVGSEEGQLKYGFEILTTRKSYAVYADSLDTKLSWLDAIRDAKAALMSDRHTLQRATIYDSIAPFRDGSSSKADRRVSLPSPSKNPPSFLGVVTPPALGRRAAAIPQLDTIPPTPGNELQSLDFPFSSPPESHTLGPSIPSPANHPPRFSSASDSPKQAISTATESSPTRRPSLARVRRWSEIRPSDAVQAIASAFLPSSTLAVEEELSSDQMEYKVIEAYHAPVWVPDSKADKCMRCGDSFGLWRRKHHCRLCGGVVCWACSTKYFIIPGYLLSSSMSSTTSSTTSITTQSQEDRLARSCDTCYTAVFDDPAPSSRFLGSSTPATTFGRSTLQPCVDKTATLHRLSRIINPRQMPLFDEVGPSLGAVPSSSPSTPPPAQSPSQSSSTSPSVTTQKRRRRMTAMGTLQDLLSKQA